MAKTKRIAVNLSLENYQVLSDLSEMAGASMSSFLNQMVSEATPGLIKVIKALKQAKNENLDSFDTLAEALELVRSSTDQATLDLEDARKSKLIRKG